MSKWKDALSAALAPTPPAGEMNDYERVAREVVEFVNQRDQSFRMEVRSRFVGSNQRLDIICFPRRRPVERSVMLNISVAAGGVVWVPVAGNMGQLKDKSPETLRDYLVETISSEHFVAAIGIYRQRNEEPVEGWLKKVDYRKVDLADVSLLVSPMEQDKLVFAYEQADFASEVEVMAELATPVGNFRPYSATTPYAMLDSGGFVLQITRHSPVGVDAIRVAGVPRAELDWRTPAS